MSEDTFKAELALRKGLQMQMDDIVRAAMSAAVLLQGSKMEKNQIRNVLNVAEESGSVAVVTNFIRYQIGRSRTGEGWQHKGFGLHVIGELEGPNGIVTRMAAAAAKIAEKELKIRDQAVPADLNLVRRARQELMRYYLGYLNRSFTYGDGGGQKAWDELGKAALLGQAGEGG